MESPTLAVLGIGFLLGLQHAIEADHLAEPFGHFRGAADAPEDAGDVHAYLCDKVV